MGRIHRLPDALANQIAAGEVVERPSSIVKELVENALDAHATRVTVDVEQGGKTLLRVTDDGDGMSPEDALLSLARHATSKIRTLDDLAAIGTFGFRGEALPSIASVSRFVLRTRERGATEAFEVHAEGAGPDDGRPAGGAVGTTVEVRDLFFNVPARRKFLKATATESAHVGDVVLGAALSRPDVTFTLARDGKVVRQFLRASSRAERAQKALEGEKLAECMFEHGDLRIFAMLAPPERARAGATGLSLLVNGRHVRDRLLARAVAQAYGSVLENGRYPVGVVWLDVPPSVVDVNVHPQKAEVRFADARGIFDAVTRELQALLARSFGLASTPARAPYATTFRDGRNTPWRAPQAEPTYASPSAFAFVPSSRTPDESASPVATASPFARALGTLPDSNLFSVADAAKAPSWSDADGENAPPFGEASLYRSLRFVGQVHATFLVCEGDDALYVLDQHAAAERVTFDRLRKQYGQRAIGTQGLLEPVIVQLPAVDVAALEDHADDVRNLGLELRSVGETAVAIHGVPTLLTRKDPESLVRDLTAELTRASGRPFGRAVDLVLATMACHGSIRAGDAVSREEAEALLRALDEVDFAGHCPHGRPVVMRLSFSELARRVGR